MREKKREKERKEIEKDERNIGICINKIFELIDDFCIVCYFKLLHHQVYINIQYICKVK